MESDSLNILLNKALDTKNVEYTKGSGQLQTCNFTFLKFIKKNQLDKADKISLKIYSYFFPCKSAIEKNMDNFWFIKYRNPNSYTEYNFAIDLLNSYIQYITDRNIENFNSSIEKSALNFGNYKNVDDFYSLIKDDFDILLAIQAFLTKDIKYFQDNFEITSSKDIQSEEFIRRIDSKIMNKKLKTMEEIYKSQYNIIKLLKNKVISLESNLNEKDKIIKTLQDDKAAKDTIIKNLQDDKAIKDAIIKNLQDDRIAKDGMIKDLQITIKNIESRLEQIDLRDNL